LASIEFPSHIKKLSKEEFDLQRIASTIAALLKKYPLFKERNPALFLQFLPIGYTHVTLSCVDPKYIEDLIIAKTKIGMWITLYDDLADNPKYRNLKLLEELYKIPHQSSYIEYSKLDLEEKNIVELSLALWRDILATVSKLPYYERFREFFEFDIQQFYVANRYSEIVSEYPRMANQTENRIYLSYNMGMVIVGMMDLMGTEDGVFMELGMMRNILFQGQILGRISNVLNTMERELKEGDFTNEVISLALQNMDLVVQDFSERSPEELKERLAPLAEKLHAERTQLYQEIRDISLETFDVETFILGLKSLHDLHENMRSKI
jgi:predicted DNA-binding protein